MNDLHTQASIFYLCDDHGYSPEMAQEKVENVALFEGTMVEYAATYFD
jgi:hypothetical protein